MNNLLHEDRWEVTELPEKYLDYKGEWHPTTFLLTCNGRHRATCASRDEALGHAQSHIAWRRSWLNTLSQCQLRITYCIHNPNWPKPGQEMVPLADDYLDERGWPNSPGHESGGVMVFKFGGWSQF